MRSIFHESWWLDAVAPGRWREVEIVESGRVCARLPYVERQRLGTRALLAPPLTNRLGPLVDLPDGRNETRLRRHDHLVDGLIDQLPPADLVRQTLHPGTLSWLPFHRRGFRVAPSLSYVLDLDDMDGVWRGIANRTRRVITTAERRLHVTEDDTAANLWPMVEATFRRQGIEPPYGRDVLDRLIAACVERGRTRVLSARDDDGTLHASLFCVWDDERAWYLGGGGDPELRASGAGSLLLWRSISEAARHVTLFDFEGSMLPAVERYFRNFGGRRETCFVVTRTSTRFAPVWAVQQRRQGRAAARDDVAER